MTRRIIKVPNRTIEGKEVCGFEVYKNHKGVPFDVWLTGPDDESLSQLLPTYKLGEVVAVAQCYMDCWDYYQKRLESKNDPSDWRTPDTILGDQADKMPGWSNKMFVKSELMPHRIRITDIKIEKLQDCSDDDILKEGIFQISAPIYRHYNGIGYTFKGWTDRGVECSSDTPKGAFKALIDKICGRGTFESNPFVFAYSFKLLD